MPLAAWSRHDIEYVVTVGGRRSRNISNPLYKCNRYKPFAFARSHRLECLWVTGALYYISAFNIISKYKRAYINIYSYIWYNIYIYIYIYNFNLYNYNTLTFALAVVSSYYLYSYASQSEIHSFQSPNVRGSWYKLALPRPQFFFGQHLSRD